MLALLLASMLGGGYVNYFSMSGRSYKVIPQVQQRYRLNARQLLDHYIRTGDGSLVPLSTYFFASIQTKTVPEALNHFQHLAPVSGSGFHRTCLRRRKIWWVLPRPGG